MYEDNQGAIFLANNRQVGMRTKHIDICHHFLRDMVEDKYIDIKYIRSEENSAYFMTKNCSEVYYVKHMKCRRGRTLGDFGNWKEKCQEYWSHRWSHGS